MIISCPCRDRIGGAVFYPCTYSLISHRRQCGEGQDSAHGIPAVDRSLRSAQEIRPADIIHVQVIAVLVQNRHIVYVQTYHRIVYPGTESAQVNRRCHGRAIIRNMQIRYDGREVFRIFQPSIFHILKEYHSHRGSQFLQRLHLFERGHKHGTGKSIRQHGLLHEFRCLNFSSFLSRVTGNTTSRHNSPAGNGKQHGKYKNKQHFGPFQNQGCKITVSYYEILG